MSSFIAKQNRFDGGIADDYVNVGLGECGMSKQFDLLSYPFRLQPLRGMEDRTEAVDTGIAMMIRGSNGAAYGVGLDNPSNPTNGELYWMNGVGSSDVWQAGSTAQLSGTTQSVAAGHFDFLVHFPEMVAARKVFWASTNLIMASDPDMDNSADSEALTFTTIGQGVVHPKDKILYFPYQTSSASLIGSIASHASDPFGSYTASAFSGMSSRYRAYCLSHYGDFLAIPMTVTGTPGDSIVGLWNRDTSINTFSQTIPWGAGSLKVLNNLNGALIGVSVLSGELSGAAQDVDKLQIKVYTGGAEPETIKEITVTRTTTSPVSITINQRVNYVYNNRFYFSANIVNGDSDANYYGLFSVGLNKLGRWTVQLERGAKNDNSETGILAACQYGDFLTCTYNSGGNIAYTVNGSTLSAIYDATSFYETGINFGMNPDHIRLVKSLEGLYVKTLPLPASAQVVVKYRLDSRRDGSWTTAITGTTDDETLFEAVTASGEQFGEFTNIELRVESVDGAIITEFGYKYSPLTKNQL